MTREERENLLKHLKYNRSIGADYMITDKDADEIIKALEQEPCTDSNLKIGDEIYIRANVNEIRNDYIICENKGGYFGTVREEIMPFVTPQQKTGHWIKSKDGYMRCDQCGSRGSAIKSRFCHHCGAKMESEG